MIFDDCHAQQESEVGPISTSMHESGCDISGGGTSTLEVRTWWVIFHTVVSSCGGHQPTAQSCGGRQPRPRERVETSRSRACWVRGGLKTTRHRRAPRHPTMNFDLTFSSFFHSARIPCWRFWENRHRVLSEGRKPRIKRVQLLDGAFFINVEGNTRTRRTRSY